MCLRGVEMVSDDGCVDDDDDDVDNDDAPNERELRFVELPVVPLLALLPRVNADTVSWICKCRSIGSLGEMGEVCRGRTSTSLGWVLVVVGDCCGCEFLVVVELRRTDLVNKEKTDFLRSFFVSGVAGCVVIVCFFVAYCFFVACVGLVACWCFCFPPRLHTMADYDVWHQIDVRAFSPMLACPRPLTTDVSCFTRGNKKRLS